jgi:hypothetical protein
VVQNPVNLLIPSITITPKCDSCGQNHNNIRSDFCEECNQDDCWSEDENIGLVEIDGETYYNYYGELHHYAD